MAANRLGRRPSFLECFGILGHQTSQNFPNSISAKIKNSWRNEFQRTPTLSKTGSGPTSGPEGHVADQVCALRMSCRGSIGSHAGIAQKSRRESRRASRGSHPDVKSGDAMWHEPTWRKPKPGPGRSPESAAGLLWKVLEFFGVRSVQSS